MRNHYTKKEGEDLLKTMVILVDSREQENLHILDYFDKKKVKYKTKQKLDFGDYSFYLPKDLEMGIMKDKYFDKDIVIERKMRLNELAGNIGDKRTQFENELIRKKDADFLLLIENASWEYIDRGEYICRSDAKSDLKRVKNREPTEEEIQAYLKKYTSKYKPKSFKASLFAFRDRYGMSINFRKRSLAGEFIFNVFKYHLREVLKNYSEVE